MHHFRTAPSPTGIAPSLPQSQQSDLLSPALGGYPRATSQSPREIDEWIAGLKADRLGQVFYNQSWVGAPYGFMPWDLEGDLCDSTTAIELVLESGMSFLIQEQSLLQGEVAVPGQGLEFSFSKSLDRTEHDHDVSKLSRWANLIGRSVADVDVYWDLEFYPAIGEERWTPVEVELFFEWGQSLIITWGRTAMQAGLPITDNDDLYVIFDELIARRYSLGPFHKALYRG